MRLIDIYELAIKKGIEKDPRSRSEIKKALSSAAKEYRKLKGIDKKAFDTERLKNPYADTRILNGDPKTDVKSVMVGIDMEAPEVILADRLGETGRGSVDLVLAHHPEGVAWARLYDVMRLQVACLKKFGIPEDVGEDLMKERSEEVARSLAPANHCRAVDAAKALGLPFMCIHTPADNQVASYLQKIFDRKKPKKLSDVVSILKQIPEYADAMKKDSGPKIFVGEADKPAGRVFVDMTGGTEGSKKVFARLSQAGVGTIVGMHMSEEHIKHIKGEHINVVIAGHIASDTLGLNLLLDEIEKVEPLKIIPASGFVRIKR